jgi:hypothetical protein
MRYLDTQGFRVLTDRSANLVISDGKPSRHALRNGYAKGSSHA